MKKVVHYDTNALLKAMQEIAIIFLLSLLIIGCKGNKAKNEVKQFQTTTESQWNGQTITGTVKNLNDTHISFVSVEFDLVDDKYHVLQTVSASNDKGIEPKGEWGFEIPASAAGARSTRLKNTIVR